MRRWFLTVFALVALVVAFGAYGSFNSVLTKVFNSDSTKIELTPEGHSLTFSIKWGWGMQQSLRVANDRSGLSSSSSSPWTEIYKRLYNSGAALYRSSDKRSYYVGTGYELIIIKMPSGDLQTTCDTRDTPPQTALGMQIAASTSYTDVRRMDPGARKLFEYIEPEQSPGTIPIEPPASKYYSDLNYLGKFGLVRGSGRGDTVRFVSPDVVAEPQRALKPECW